MNRTARSPGRAEPLTATIRSDEVSYRRPALPAASSRRWSITGTAASTVTRCSSIKVRAVSGSKRGRRTNVLPRAMPSARWASPQVWNIGAAIKVTSDDRRGIMETMARRGSMVAGASRNVPFGVPVVPEVRRI